MRSRPLRSTRGSRAACPRRRGVDASSGFPWAGSANLTKWLARRSSSRPMTPAMSLATRSRWTAAIWRADSGRVRQEIRRRADDQQAIGRETSERPIAFAQRADITELPPVATFLRVAVLQNERLASADDVVVNAYAVVDRVAHLPSPQVASTRKLLAFIGTASA